MITLKTKIVKARKNHTCNLCGGIIDKEEKYNCQTNVHDGRIYDFKTHVHCSELASEYNMYDDCDEGLTEDDFIEYMDELMPGDESPEDKALSLSKATVSPQNPDR